MQNSNKILTVLGGVITIISIVATVAFNAGYAGLSGVGMGVISLVYGLEDAINGNAPAMVTDLTNAVNEIKQSLPAAKQEVAAAKT